MSNKKYCAQSLASLGMISGVNFIALAMLPLIFILPFKKLGVSKSYLHESVLWVKLAANQVNEVVIEHNKGGVNLISLAFKYLS